MKFRSILDHFRKALRILRSAGDIAVKDFVRMVRRRYYAVILRSVSHALRDTSHPYHQPLKRLFHKHHGQSTKPYSGKLVNQNIGRLELGPGEHRALRHDQGIETIRDLVEAVLELTEDHPDRDTTPPADVEHEEPPEESPAEQDDNANEEEFPERSGDSAENGEDTSSPAPDEMPQENLPEGEESSNGSAPKDGSPSPERPSSPDDERPDPQKRGGRPRTEEQGDAPKPSSPASQRPRIEIQCVRERQQWMLVATLDGPNDDQLEALTVRQNGEELSPGDAENLSWRLNDVSGEIKATMASDQEPITKTLDDDSQLVFKLATDQGRYVRKPGREGDYLVIAPDSWERDEGLSGPPAVHPEACSIMGYTAHHFDLGESSSTVAFHIPRYGRHIIHSKAPTFSIVGQPVEDEIPEMGELFVGDLPKIRASNIGDWNRVSEVIIGEEGPGEGRWRKSIDIDPAMQEQALPPELVDRKLGWYFLRFYDEYANLMDSESRHFRYLASINAINIDSPSSVPGSSNGHAQARIVFHHEPECSFSCDNDQIEIRRGRNDEETVAVVPPDPAADVARFRISTNNGESVDIALAVERLWWAVGTEDCEPEQWTDQLVALSKADFRAASKRALWIRLPRPGWLEQMQLGFAGEETRPYRAEKHDRSMCIPLREFGESPALRQLGEHALMARFSDGEERYLLPVGSLKLNASCKVKNCEFESSDRSTVIDHVADKHVNDYFSPLTYEELRERMPDLPRVIHRCPYCDFWVPVDRSIPEESPTSQILRHCDEDHPERRPSDKRVKDVTDVRDIYPDITTTYKCKMCQDEFSNPDIEVMKRHLIDQHSDELYVLT